MTQAQSKFMEQIKKATYTFCKDQQSIAVKRGLALKGAKLEKANLKVKN